MREMKYSLRVGVLCTHGKFPNFDSCILIIPEKAFIPRKQELKYLGHDVCNLLPCVSEKCTHVDKSVCMTAQMNYKGTDAQVLTANKYE